MEIEEVAGLDSIEDSLNSPSRRVGGLSPLPQIRAVIVSEHRQVNNFIIKFLLNPKCSFKRELLFECPAFKRNFWLSLISKRLLIKFD